MLRQLPLLVGLGAVAFSPMLYAQAAKNPPLNVTVVNDTLRPVPVTGSIGVVGDVAVTNTPTVDVNGLGGKAVEPGRYPYQEFANFNPGSANCPNSFYCYVAFDPVPAGYRLVVTHVQAEFTMEDPNVDASGGVGADGSIFGDILRIPGMQIGRSTLSNSARYLASGPVMFFIEPGRRPTVFTFGNKVNPTSSSAYVGLVGYLVPIP